MTAKASGVAYYFELAVLVVVVLVGVPLVLLAMTAEGEGVPIWFGSIWIGGALFILASYLTTAREISLMEDGTVEFRRWIGTVQMPASDIFEVSRDFTGQRLAFRAASKTVNAHRQLDGLFELLTEIRSINPGLAIRRL